MEKFYRKFFEIKLEKNSLISSLKKNENREKNSLISSLKKNENREKNSLISSLKKNENRKKIPWFQA